MNSGQCSQQPSSHVPPASAELDLSNPGQQRHLELSVVVPVFNDEEVLPEFHRRLAAVLDSMTPRAEIVLVNDGSFDRSLEVTRSLMSGDG